MPSDANLLAFRFEFQCGREFELLLLFLCNFFVSGVLSSGEYGDAITAVYVSTHCKRMNVFVCTAVELCVIQRIIKLRFYVYE